MLILLFTSALVLACAEKPLDIPPCDVLTSEVITGIVHGQSGPEAGVWVIAETNDLQTGYIKIVVTDEQGRFLLPDMPEANYDIWVRGYGLKDSEKIRSKLGDKLTLNARYPANAQEAAQLYPANYWHALARPPSVADFPGTGEGGNGIAERITTQEAWIDGMKQLCHQLGTPETRGIEHWGGAFKDSKQAWSVRLSMAPMEHHAKLMGHMNRH